MGFCNFGENLKQVNCYCYYVISEVNGTSLITIQLSLLPVPPIVVVAAQRSLILAKSSSAVCLLVAVRLSNFQ